MREEATRCEAPGAGTADAGATAGQAAATSAASETRAGPAEGSEPSTPTRILYWSSHAAKSSAESGSKRIFHRSQRGHALDDAVVAGARLAGVAQAVAAPRRLPGRLDRAVGTTASLVDTADSTSTDISASSVSPSCGSDNSGASGTPGGSGSVPKPPLPVGLVASTGTIAIGVGVDVNLLAKKMSARHATVRAHGHQRRDHQRRRAIERADRQLGLRRAAASRVEGESSGLSIVAMSRPRPTASSTPIATQGSGGASGRTVAYQAFHRTIACRRWLSSKLSGGP